MAFSEKLLRFTFTLGTGTFTGTNANTVTLEGLRATAQISLNTISASLAGGVSAIAVVFGLPLSQINQLTVAGLQYRVDTVGKNMMTIEANSGTDTRQYSSAISWTQPRNFNASPKSRSSSARQPRTRWR
jgi:hypothetical protein